MRDHATFDLAHMYSTPPAPDKKIYLEGGISGYLLAFVDVENISRVLVLRWARMREIMGQGAWRRDSPNHGPILCMYPMSVQTPYTKRSF